MVQRNIRFMTTGQLMTFCNVCQKMNADITVKDVTGRFEIDAKSIVGLHMESVSLLNSGAMIPPFQ